MIAGSLELFPKRTALILIIANQVILGSFFRKFRDLFTACYCGIPQAIRPRTIVPGLNLPLCAGLIACLAAGILAVFIMA